MQVFSTRDSYLIIAAGNDNLYRQMCQVLDRPDLAEDPDYATNDLRNRNAAALEAEIEAVLKTKDTADWLTVFDAAGVPASAINDVAQVMAHPQAGPRNMIVDVDDPTAGKLKVAGNPIKVSGYADPDRRDTAPDLDADREKILKELAG